VDIKEFLEMSAGKWFSQRTSYGLAFKDSDNGKADIVIDILPSDDVDVVKLCQQHSIESSQAWGGAKVTTQAQAGMPWERTKGQTNSNSSLIMVPIAESDCANRGQLLHSAGAAGTYSLGDDEALTLVMNYPNMSAEERIWFASPNLRLRTTVFQDDRGFSMATFCSEIRMGGGK
jgi:CpeS-like protein